MIKCHFCKLRSTKFLKYESVHFLSHEISLHFIEPRCDVHVKIHVNEGIRTGQKQYMEWLTQQIINND